MFKNIFTKIFVITLLAGLSIVLLVGAVSRTLAKTENNNSEGVSHQTAAILDDNTSIAPVGDGTTQSYGQGYRGGDQTSEAGLTPEDDPQTGDQGYGQGATGNPQGAAGNPAGNAAEYAALPPADPAGLSAEEAEGLLFMREEEKLAHDVYITLNATWNLPVFGNIASSEQSHTDAIAVLLERYGLPDPAQSEVGVFTNPDLQTLYNELVAQGSQSLADALKVGGAIEEIDILDLRTRLAQTDNADIIQVYTNLLNGSGNHLRAFANTLLTQTGETYQPQYLSLEDYQAILSAAGGNGNGRGGPGGGQGNRQP